MNFEQYIPFEEKKFRPHQKEVIEKVVDSIENGTETILVNAPVGFGKSLVGYCVSKYLQEQGEQSYIFTKTTFLQDQYLRDFSDIKTAMGRSNFECLMSEGEYTCDYGICKQRKYSCPIGAETQGGVFLKELEEGYSEHCLYWKQKYEAIRQMLGDLGRALHCLAASIGTVILTQRTGNNVYDT